MPAYLPTDPSLGRMQEQAEALLRDGGAADPDEARDAVARSYGFGDWSRLCRYLDVAAELTRTPAAEQPCADPADEYCRLGCLTYEADSPERRAAAGLPAEHHVWSAAAAADVPALRRLLVGPSDVDLLGGPFRWTPLMYLAYSRTGDGDPVAAAAVLLDAGADPNAGYLWHGLQTPFTVLTGVLGEGEGGPRAQPRHPRWTELATLLLERGADANDAQGLYDRMFERDDAHLRLLFGHDLGAGDGGVWRRRLGEAAATPAELLADQLAWAIERDMPERVRLLAAHGVDVTAPLGARHGEDTPMLRARRRGDTAIVAVLREYGVPDVELDAPDEVVAEALAGSRPDATPDVVAAARHRDPEAILRAVAVDRPGAVEVLAGLGFDVNAAARPGRGWPRESTALHQAAADGNPTMVRLLLRLGADPSLVDGEYDATAEGWAEYLGQPDAAAALRSARAAPAPKEPAPKEPAPKDPAPQRPAAAPAPQRPEQTRDDTDVGWGDDAYRHDDNDRRLLDDRPPHWG